MPKPQRELALEHFLPYQLSVLANTMSSAIALAYRQRFHLSIPEWRVLAVLARHPGLAAAECAERTAMDKVAVSRAVAGLLRAQRVRRSRAAGDRRRSHLVLTARGRAVYREVVPWALAYEAAVLSGLPVRARRDLAQAIELLRLRATALSARPRRRHGL